jgi:hypothetical protein
MQPTYFSPLHYWNRVLSSDVFVILDNAQYIRKYWQNQMWLRTVDGEKVIASLPIRHTGQRFAIRDAEIDTSQRWARKHYATILSLYKKATFFPRFEPFLEWHYRHEARMVQGSFYKFVRSEIEFVLNMLGYRGAILEASTLGVDGKASEWMLNICLKVGLPGEVTYLCGGVAYEEYMDIEAFERAGVDIEVQDWNCPVYQQRGSGFVPNLSILDLLLNEGEKMAKNILGQGYAPELIKSAQES